MGIFNNIKSFAEDCGVFLVTFIISLCVILLPANGILWLIYKFGIESVIIENTINLSAILVAIILSLRAFFFYKKSQIKRRKKEIVKTLDGLNNKPFAKVILSLIENKNLTIGTLEEFRKGHKEYYNWGNGLLTGSKEWIIHKLSDKLIDIKAEGINCSTIDYDMKLKRFTARIEASIPPGVLAGYYIGRIGDKLFGLFGYGFDFDETENPKTGEA